MSQAYVSNVENGKINPRIGNALRITRALGIDSGELRRVTEKYILCGAVARVNK